MYEGCGGGGLTNNPPYPHFQILGEGVAWEFLPIPYSDAKHCFAYNIFWFEHLHVLINTWWGGLKNFLLVQMLIWMIAIKQGMGWLEKSCSVLLHHIFKWNSPNIATYVACYCNQHITKTPGLGLSGRGSCSCPVITYAHTWFLVNYHN